jgi:exosome complex RNA-binding protein Rrp4
MTALAKGRKSPIPSSRSIRLVERHGSMLDSIKSHSSINLIIFSWHMI